MAVEIGTASGYLDLAAKLKIFLTTHVDLVAASEEWVCLRDDGSDMIFQGPGLSGSEEIFIGLEPFDNVGSDIYSWDIAGFTGYIPGNSFDVQPGRNTTYASFLPLWTNDIPYWFVGNGQRVIVIAKISTSYQSMYMGKLLPFATPGQYPYPVFCGGMTNQPTYRYSHDSIRFIPHTFYSSYLFFPDGVLNKVTGATPTPTLNQGTMWPTGTTESVSYVGLAKAAPFDSGDVCIIPLSVYVGAAGSNQGVLAEFDGLYWIHGTSQSSQTIVTIDSVDYMVVQDGTRLDLVDYMAVRMV